MTDQQDNGFKFGKPVAELPGDGPRRGQFNPILLKVAAAKGAWVPIYDLDRDTRRRIQVWAASHRSLRMATRTVEGVLHIREVK